MKWFNRVGLSLLVLSLCSVAHADPKDDARRYFMSGLEAAKGGEYQRALDLFLEAQRVAPHPATLYNIARAYQDMGDLENAIVYYRLYRDSVPERAADVEPVIQVLTARLVQPEVEESTASISVSGLEMGDLDELQALVNQINGLTEKLLTQAEQATQEAGDPFNVDPIDPVDPVDPLPTPELPEGEFLSDAYDRVVVTASRYGQDPLDSPSSLTVITADDIQLSAARSVPDLLRQVVGMDVMNVTSGQTDISIRGFNSKLSNKVLVLIDGRSVYWDFIGTTMWESVPIVLEEIERIEVIRGPGSAVYGASAVTGVVNIITRTPGETPLTITTAEAGSPDYQRFATMTTGRVAKTSYRFAADYRRHGVWSKAPFSENASVDFYQPNNDLGLNTIHTHGRLDWAVFDEGLLSLSAGYTQGFNEFANFGALGTYGLNQRAHFLRGDVSYGPIHVRAFWNHGTLDTGPLIVPHGDPNNQLVDAKIDTVDFEAEANQEFETGSIAHRINGGVGYRFKGLRGFDYVNSDVIDEHHFRGFLSEEATIGKVKLIASLRVDAHPLLKFQETLSPRGALIFRVLDKTALRVTAGTAFRAPNQIESYMKLTLPTAADGLFVYDYGSEELAPERILTVEVGAHDESSLFHTADVAVYFNRLTDIIALQAVTPFNGSFDEEVGGYQVGSTGFGNTDSVYTGYGVEADLNLFPVDGLDINANVNLQQIVENTGIQTLADRSTSPIKANFGATFRSKFRTDFTASSHFLSGQTWRIREFDDAGNIVFNEQEIPSRFILSGRVAVRPLASADLEFAATAWNVLGFNESGRFREHPTGQLIGSRVFGSVTYKF